MLIFIELLLILVAFLNPQSKKIAKAIVLFMILIYGLNTYSGDFLAYQGVYNNISYYGLTHYEFLFSLLMMICSKIGFTFIQFRMVLGIIYSILCYKNFSRYTKYTALALALSLIFPFTYYVSVLRAGIAAMIMLYSIRFLDTETRKGTVKFIAMMIVCTLFHYSSIFFLILIMARKGVSGKYLFYIFLGTCVVAYGFNNLELLSRIIGNFTDRAKTLQWFSATSNINLNWKGILFQIVIVFANIFINRLGKKQMDKNSSLNYFSGDLRFYHWFSGLACNASYLLVVFIPFMFVNDVAMRFLWAVLGITICSCLNTVYVLDSIRSSIGSSRRGVVTVMQLVLVAYIMLVAVYANLPYIGTDNSATQIFFNNLLNFF